MALHPYLACAEIVNTHGVKGGVRLSCLCNTPTDLAALKTVYRLINGVYEPLHVVHASLQKQMVLATFREVDTMDGAIALKGVTLYAKREDLPLKKGDCFIADLLGLPVRDAESGHIYGVLDDVLQPAAQQIYQVKKPDGTVFLIPVVKEFVKALRPDGDDPAIEVKLIEGMTE